MLAFSGQALAVCPDSGFEDDDGNLVFDGSCTDGDPPTSSDLDWNDFDPVTWLGDAPYRTGESLYSGWEFAGIEDDEVSNIDTAFSGGTKQDDECPTVKGAKAPNKDDLRRIYLSSSTVGGEVFLNLAWVRIPQNTTSASAHVAFEFNKGQTDSEEDLCGGSSDGLVIRQDGDMLVVYDFEGGSAEPVIKLARWTTEPADSCDIANNTPPCWGVATELGAGVAEAAVNFGVAVTDEIGPNGTALLQDQEFGEAGINLTAAGVFTPGVCESFGSAFAVSRSSGNSGNAQMKDLVGPAPFELNNCGTIIIEKQTIGGDGTFGYTFTGLDLTAVTTSGGSNVMSGSFDLVTSSNSASITINDVPAGSYTAEETTVASGFTFKDLICVDDADGGNNNVNTSSPSSLQTGGTPKAFIEVDFKETVKCTFRNEQADLTVTKSVVNACDASDGGKFNLLIDGTAEATNVGDGGTTGAVTVSVGSHTVSETAGTGTSLTDYIDTIGGDCSSTGSITLSGGQSATCTIENVRKPTVTITKVIVGATETLFDLLVAGNVEADNVGDTGSTGAVTITSPYNASTKQFGPVTLSETLGNTDPVPSSGFDTFWTCDNLQGTRSGSGTSISIGPLEAGEDVSCTVVNTVIKLNECVISP